MAPAWQPSLGRGVTPSAGARGCVGITHLQTLTYACCQGDLWIDETTARLPPPHCSPRARLWAGPCQAEGLSVLPWSRGQDGPLAAAQCRQGALVSSAAPGSRVLGAGQEADAADAGQLGVGGSARSCLTCLRWLSALAA